MLLKETRRTSNLPLVVALTVFLAGVLTGFVMDQPYIKSWLAPERPRIVSAQWRGISSQLLPSDQPLRIPENGLETLEIEISRKEAHKLEEQRQEALAKGILLQDDNPWIDARVRHGPEVRDVKLRLKGDWLDHLKSNKWSFRIGVKGETLMGMKVFSIQAPETRGMGWEWLLLEAARREDLLAPRVRFVQVVVNGNYNGIFFLEEHFTKEMLEAQGRREGPVVCFVEDTLWLGRLGGTDRIFKETYRPTTLPEFAEMKAFGEGRIAGVDDLNRQLHHAFAQLRDVQRIVLGEQRPPNRLQAMQAALELEGKTVERLFDAERLGKAYALLTLFQAGHGLIWHNQRFYHDPLTARLEPVFFDNSPHETQYMSDLPIYEYGPFFMRSPVFVHAYFKNLGRMLRPDYLPQLWTELEKPLRANLDALNQEAALPPAFTFEHMRDRLSKRQEHLRRALYFQRPLALNAVLELPPQTDLPVAGTLRIEAWTTTRTPVVLKGFQFSNGERVPAWESLEKPPSPERRAGADGVLLFEGDRLVFRFPIDERLAGLEEIEELKRAALKGWSPSQIVKIKLEAICRPLGSDTDIAQQVLIRKTREEWESSKHRPAAPELDKALQRHDFLHYEFEAHRLWIKNGVWNVQGDLIVPDGIPLYVEAGTTLRFQQDAILLAGSGSVQLLGSAERPVVLEPAEGHANWGGIAVLAAPDPSRWTHAIVRNTSGIRRGAWQLTGGVTFFRAQVNLEHVRFEGSLAEDALNIVKGMFELRACHFQDTSSDAYDGDFVQGLVSECVFERIAGDALDFSGSDVAVDGGRYEAIGDKAISTGEGSMVRVKGGVVERAMLGVVSKDGSSAEVEDLEIREASQYALAVYIKKAAYGPASLSARRIRVGRTGAGRMLVQTGCTLILDDEAQPTEPLDVKKLYEANVLGH